MLRNKHVKCRIKMNEKQITRSAFKANAYNNIKILHKHVVISRQNKKYLAYHIYEYTYKYLYQLKTNKIKMICLFT